MNSHIVTITVIIFVFTQSPLGGPLVNLKDKVLITDITAVPCHIENPQGYHDRFPVQSLHLLGDPGVLFVLSLHLEDLRHCPILGRGQEVKIAVFSALCPDWTASRCRFPQFNTPCRNKTHSVGSYVYSSNVEAKLIMRADYCLYIAR